MFKTLSIALLTVVTFFASATETQIMVRAKAKDAKFIGSSIGGAHVIIRNQLTGAILSEGITSGSTGNTGLLMNTPIERGTSVSDENTAGFLATLDIDQPTFISIEVTAPINQKQSHAKTSTELWLIPGKHLLGDGVVIEIPGFVIDAIAPRTHERIAIESLEDGKLEISANIVMMCGCPISSGGIWDADQMEVVAQISKDSQLVEELPMNVTATSLFKTSFEPKEKGSYEIVIYAYNPSTNNTGVDKVNFILN